MYTHRSGTHTLVPTQTQAHTNTGKNTHIHTDTDTDTHRHTDTHTDTHTHTHTHTQTHTHTHTHTHTLTHTHTDTHTHTERQTHTHTHTHTHESLNVRTIYLVSYTNIVCGTFNTKHTNNLKIYKILLDIFIFLSITQCGQDGKDTYIETKRPFGNSHTHTKFINTQTKTAVQ